MKFFLQSDGDQSMIDTKQHDGYSLRAQPIEADSWIEAKKKFGFDLTEIQASMLKQQQAVQP